jgi:6,7-dimethyl-8-ribityllumazine synthase
MTYEGDFRTPTGRFTVVAARFNSFIVDQLLAGVVDTFTRHGLKADQWDVVRVPGAFEIPVVAGQLAESGKYAAIITLGCIIRGDTDHYDHVASAATSGILNAGMKSGVPVIFGVLTCETLEQAIHRAGAKAGNKGSEAALAAIEMVNLLGKLPGK